MLDLPVALRVKRRRDCAAPAEIIVEARASEHNVLAASLTRSLAVAEEGASAPAEAPARKRCRFVLVPGSCNLQTAAADEGNSSSLIDGPVLHLWHTPGLGSAAEGAAGAHAGAARSQQQHGLAEQHVYSDMLQEYMQQQQQGGTAEQKQHPGHYKRPSRRSSSSTAAASGSSDAAQSQQQPQAQNQPQQQLPAYMTRGMLKQYGLWSGQQAGTAAGVPHAQHQQEAAEDDMEYAYDVYVPAEPGSSSGWETPPAAAAAAGSSGVQDPGAAYTAGMDASGLHVIQLWEDELLQLHQEWALGQRAAADADSEDSNAEDHYANDYPEEEEDEQEGSRYPDSLDSSDAADDVVHAARRQHRGGLATDPTSGIGVYQPTGSSGQHSRQRAGVESYGVGGDSSASYDVEDYVSSGDEQGPVGDEEFGPAWLRKHCVGYGGAAGGGDGGGGGGQAWRSVLAQQFAPQ